jgi:hypothetical protein
MAIITDHTTTHKSYVTDDFCMREDVIQGNDLTEPMLDAEVKTEADSKFYKTYSYEYIIIIVRV